MRLHRLALVASVFLAYAPCSAERDTLVRKLSDLDVTPAVIGGQPAPRGRYSWMASLRTNNPPPGFFRNFHFCGGTLIHPSVVMTAAHCLLENDTGLPRPDFYYLPKVRIGGYYVKADKPGDFELREIERTVTHPNYLYNNVDNKLNNDIALLLLKTPSTQTPIALPPYTPKPGLPAAAGTQSAVVGWGATVPLGKAVPGKPIDSLQQLRTKLMSSEQCQAVYPVILSSIGTRLAFNFFNNTMICAGNYPAFGNGVCLGDSGGPLFLPGRAASKDVQLGISSWTAGGCAEAPDVFTDVAALRPWIDQTVAALTAPVNWTGRVYGDPIVVGFDQGRFTTTQQPCNKLKILITPNYRISAMLARGPTQGITVMRSITFQRRDTVVVSVVNGRAEVSVNGQKLRPGGFILIQGGSVRYRNLRPRWSHLIAIAQPGLAIRINQPFRKKSRQHMPWLDVWVTLTRAPTTRLWGVLGSTFPKGVTASAAAGGGNFTAVVASSREEELLQA